MPHTAFFRMPKNRVSARTVRAAVGVAAATTRFAPPPGPPKATPTLLPGGKVYAGAAGDAAALQTATRTPVGVHAYGKFEGSVPQGRMITVGSSSNWRTVAAAQPGSALYTNIVRWATTIKSRGGVVLLAYSHEPEVASNTSMGSAADFKAAFARVVTIFRQQGVTNVKYTLQLTAWAFRANPRDRVAAANWYPGDGYVDVVGADAYNWYTCGEGRGNWMELSALAAPALAFAKARNKFVALPEFGVTRDARRAQWLTNAKNYIVANEAWFAGVYYFNRPPTNQKNANCVWTLSSSAEYAAYGSLLRDPNFAY